MAIVLTEPLCAPNHHRSVAAGRCAPRRASLSGLPLARVIMATGSPLPAPGAALGSGNISGMPMAQVCSLVKSAVPIVLGAERERSDESAIKAADTFLNKFQRSAEAWAACAQLMDEVPLEGDGILVVTEAARVLVSKARHDMADLRPESFDGLRSLLFRHLLKLAATPAASAAFRHVATGVAACAVTMDGWSGIMASLIAAFGGPDTLRRPDAVGHVLSFLRVLTELPFEANRENTTVSTHRRAAVIAELKAAGDGVHSVLDVCLASHASNATIRSAALGCFSEWVSRGYIPNKTLATSRVLVAAVAGLREASVFEECAKTLADVAWSLGGEAEEAMGKSIAENLFPGMVDLEGLLNALLPVQEADPTDLRASSLITVVSLLGKTVMSDLLDDSHPLARLRPRALSMMARCLASPSRSAVRDSFPFWHSFLSVATNRTKRGEALSPDIVAAIDGLVPFLVNACLLPAEDFVGKPVCLGLSKEEAAARVASFTAKFSIPSPTTQDEAEEHRSREEETSVLTQWAEDCVLACCTARGRQHVLTALVALCGSHLTASRTAADPQSAIRSLEATLLCLKFAAPELLPETEPEHLASLFGALGTLPDVVGVHETALGMVSAMSRWVVVRPAVFVEVERFVAAHLRRCGDTAEKACTAASALYDSAPDRTLSSGITAALIESVSKCAPW
jgi:hypothetical protein